MPEKANGESSTNNADQPTNGRGLGSTSQNAQPIVTMTITESATQQPDEVLLLTLRPRPQVTWDEGVMDNEGLGRKSSKRCCIFHKQRAFGESSTDSSDEENNGNQSDGSSSSGGPTHNGGHKPIARKKKNGSISAQQQKRVPDYQRFHA